MLQSNKCKNDDMKKYFVRVSAFLLLGLAMSQSVPAQFVIKVRPAAPVVRARPVCPGPRHIWVAGDYVWRGGQYVYTDGYWAVPPKRHTRWIEGRWKHRRGGWIWIPGHWR